MKTELNADFEPREVGNSEPFIEDNQNESTLDNQKTADNDVRGQTASATTPEQGSEGDGVSSSNPIKYYTLEEMEKITADNLDTSRIPPSLYKAMQAGVTKRFQSLAEEKRQFEEERKNENAPRDIFESYLENPREIITFINSEIDKLVSVGSFDDGYDDAQRQVKHLEALKDDLRERREAYKNSNIRMREITTKAQSEVFQKIKDFETKAPLIGTFLESKGFSPEEIATFSNPSVKVQTKKGFVPLGSLASKFVILANEFYDMANAGRAAEKKISKQSPSPLERGGSGNKTKENTTLGEIFYGSKNS